MRPILVTGGALGLGAEICRQLAQEGHDLVVHYRTGEEEAENVVSDCQQHGIAAEKIQGDFSTPEGVEAFLTAYSSRFHETKGIVHNVGTYTLAPLLETPLNVWQKQMQTNFFAPVQIIGNLIEEVRKNRGGIVLLGVAGLNPLHAKIQTTAHGCSKAALWCYTRSLAKELAPSGVRVNMVSPGYLETTADAIDPKRVPMGRLGSLAETARCITFLFREESSYITGQNIEISGGLLL